MFRKRELVIAALFALAGSSFAGDKVEMRADLNKADFEATKARLVEQL